MQFSKQAAVFLSLITSQQVFATDGYFSQGYGVKSQGMGGVGIALLVELHPELTHLAL